jgi:hypothetical protein
MPLLVNGNVVVTTTELPMLQEYAQPPEVSNNFGGMIVGLPVLVVTEGEGPVDCGDGWLAVARWDTIYAWNDALLKEELDRAVRESSHALYPEPDPPMGLFQQRSLGHWDYPLMEPRPKYTFGDFGGIA